MPRNVIPIRGSNEEHEKWKTAAGSQSFSSWARMVLNEAADASTAEYKDREHQKSQRETQLATAYPQRVFRPDPK